MNKFKAGSRANMGMSPARVSADIRDNANNFYALRVANKSQNRRRTNAKRECVNACNDLRTWTNDVTYNFLCYVPQISFRGTNCTIAKIGL